MSEFERLTIEQGYMNFYLALAVAIISFLSLIGFYFDYKHRKKKERAEKSIEIAKNFADEIIAPISFLYSFFNEHKLDKIIKKIDFLKLDEFDMNELREIYSNVDVEEYNQIMSKEDPDSKIHAIIINTLNKLEYMCMYIATGVADEKYIYSSLHQQFFSTIATLYFEISFININDKDKYYTNIIHVYNLWKKKYIKAIKRETKFKKKQKRMKKKLYLPPAKIK